ncbi:unnamed protein product [Acanthosepion pharaonis]|uniref:Uncharacterized protein n=1 Tax=Acanthosepion pharaonis TaxID=158019 RepID=A0A812EVB8_ACAPH|nr:unnamed protein product [Sepia pharaonis]
MKFSYLANTEPINYIQHLFSSFIFSFAYLFNFFLLFFSSFSFCSSNCHLSFFPSFFSCLDFTSVFYHLLSSIYFLSDFLFHSYFHYFLSSSFSWVFFFSLLFPPFFPFKNVLLLNQYGFIYIFVQSFSFFSLSFHVLYPLFLPLFFFSESQSLI